MSKLYECSECGELFTKHEIDWVRKLRELL